MTTSETTLVMSGRLEEFRLADLLQAVGASRQCTAVELRRRDGAVFGTIWIERGRVVDAERGDAHGRAAFYELFRPGGADTFVVQRLRDRPVCPAPIGSVASLVLEALERQRGFADGSGVAPLPPARPGTFDGVWDEPTVARPIRKGGVVLAIASARGGVGRTTIALELARAFGRAGRLGLLIDADGGELAARVGATAAPRSLEELLDSADAIDDAMVTLGSRLRLLAIASPPAGRVSLAAEWHALIARARSRADLTILDCPAGFASPAADAMLAASHVLGVVRSDRSAIAATEAIEEHVDSIVGGPELAGVVINLFDGRSPPSVEAFQRVAAQGAPLCETTIPRADALAGADLSAEPGPIAWLFDALAGELQARTGLVEPSHAALAWLRAPR